MGGSSKKQTVGYKYYLGEHLALCHGPVDKLVRVRIDKRDVWLGANTGGRITIDKPSLFGGESREGGVSGSVDIEIGGPAQGQNDYLLARLGNPLPAFRGVVCAVLRQVYLGMNPYLKPWEFRMQRVHTRQDGIAQWYDAVAAIEAESISGVLDTETFSGVHSFDTNDATGYELYGGGLRNTLVQSFNGSYYSRELQSPNAVVTGVSLDFTLTAVGTSDPAIFVIWDQSGNKVFSFDPRRESATDSLQRPAINTHYQSGIPIGSAALAVDTAFHLDVELDYTALQANATITQGGAVVATGAGAIESKKPAYSIGFQRDGDFPESQALYDNIEVRGYVPQGDMNPAHIIRECLTDPDWGMSYPEADIDDAAFQAAADTLFGESMGMSLLWDRSIALEDFIGEVLRHIDAVLYVDRNTGKFTLELIRGDYIASNLLLLDENNVSRIERFKRPTLGELVNSITVTYWNAETGEDASINATDLALMQLQGSMISESVQYPGFTNSTIAGRVLARDLRARSTPLATCVIYANRDAADLHVGSPFRLTWPDLDITDLVMRVTKIDYGDQGNPLIRIECIEDVFDLPESVTAEQGSLWTDAVSDPTACPYRALLEAPYYELVQHLGEDAINTELGTYPERGYLVAAGSRPSDDAIHAILMTDAGAGYNEAAPPMAFSPSAVLDADIGRTDTVLSIAAGVDLDLVSTGTHMQIGTELCRVDAISETSLTVGRGVLDTVPAAHSAGETLLFWDDFPATDGTAYADAESVSAKLLPVTGSGTLAQAAAPVDTVVFGRRAIRPYPPGKVTVNGMDYGEVIAGTAALVIGWADRDRLQQTAGDLIDTTAASIGPELGTTYNLRIYDEQDALIHTETGAANPYTYPTATELTEGGQPGGGDPVPLDINDFEGETIGSPPTGWVSKWTSATWQVVAGQWLQQVNPAVNGWRGLACPLGDAQGRNIEITVKTQYDNATTSTHKSSILFCASGAAGNEAGYMLELVHSSNSINTTDLLQIARLDTGSLTALQNTAFAASAGNWYWLKVRIDTNGRMLAKAWADSSTEPSAWMLDVTDSTYTSGWVGVGARNGQLTFLYDDYSVLDLSPNPDRINGRLRFELESERDGYASWQQHNITVLREGYGFNYGELYGGAP